MKKKILSIIFLPFLLSIASCFPTVDMEEINSKIVEHTISYDYKGQHYDEEIGLQTLFSFTHWPTYAYPITHVKVLADDFVDQIFTIRLKSNSERLKVNFNGIRDVVVKHGVWVEENKNYFLATIEGEENDNCYEIELDFKINGGLLVKCYPFFEETNSSITSFSVLPDYSELE